MYLYYKFQMYYNNQYEEIIKSYQIIIIIIISTFILNLNKNQVFTFYTISYHHLRNCMIASNLPTT